MLDSGSGRKIVSDWNKLSDTGRGRKPFQEFEAENRRVTSVPVIIRQAAGFHPFRRIRESILQGCEARTLLND